MNKSTREKEAVLSVFAELVRPLMRVAFEYGISASEIAGVVRRTFIQALESRLLEQKRATTDARLALVAGLTKSDVTALRQALRSGAPHSMRAPVSLDQVTNLLTVWHTHTGFSGAYGLAMELDLVPTHGSPRRSFQDLVDLACPGVDPEGLLDELVASGSVEIIESVTVRCLSRAYLPKEADVKRIEWMGRILSNVATSFVHNLLRTTQEPAYMERAVVSDEPLSEVGRDKFLTIAGERGQELLTDLDTFLTRLAASERSDTGKKYGVGVYFFEDRSTERPPDIQHKPYIQKTARRGSPVEEIDVLAGLVPNKK
ncbi:MAG: hypothetical protein E6K41_14450 [Gammaproteobacteria bacterium]|nr:MAG: hypothetical protein E6K41_14450 [Gammaproteobacteria bacterium]TLY98107.1 MAG: hypothetical protein E6K38_02440 [Gammaproteobacteria bacterium]TLZ30114.1 MAG: hypothetical protein E6K29_07710 [Gammaproteobacteria bacterium]TLZ55341.1 MAG: hypothetical protein E6K22_03790 [Gammaproteobacteria bacterium]TLZ62569.1 MAG: hypothetical protein E6K20_05105 [Gammaproteobacteria bacterium]